MARDGAWMQIGDERLKRKVKSADHWVYSQDKDKVMIGFTVSEMKFFISAETKGAKIYRYLYCFSITNPFLQYVE